jgi:hypothetical protein
MNQDEKFYKKWIEILGRHGINEDDFKKTKVVLTKKFRKEPSTADIFWSLWNQAVTNLTSLRNFIYLLWHERF